MRGFVAVCIRQHAPDGSPEARASLVLQVQRGVSDIARHTR